MSDLPLVSVFQFGSERCNSVNLRDVWKFVESSRKFADWVKVRLKRAVDGVDFISVHVGVNGQKGYAKDYIATIDFAKSICMMEDNEKGDELRRYFIKCEKIALGETVANPQPTPTQTPHEQTHLTLAQACATFGWRVPDEEWCVRMGQLASIVAMVLNYEAKRIPHPKYGSVNAHNKAVWEELNTDFDSFRTTETMNRYLLAIQKDLSDTKFRFNIPVFSPSNGSPLSKLSRNLVKSA